MKHCNRETCIKLKECGFERKTMLILRDRVVLPVTLFDAQCWIFEIYGIWIDPANKTKPLESLQSCILNFLNNPKKQTKLF